MVKRVGLALLGVVTVGILPLSGLVRGAIAQPSTAAERVVIDGQLTADSPVYDDGTYYNLYPLTVQAGDSIQVDLISTEFDGVLKLYDSEGQNLAQNNNGGEGNNAKLIETIPTEGDYAIVVLTDQPGAMGRYQIRAQAAAPDVVAQLARAQALSQQVAAALQTQDYQQALPWAQEALALRHGIFGDDHFYTMTSLTLLGYVYRELGEYRQAEQVLQRALAGIGTELGEFNQSAAIAHGNIADLYVKMGRYSEAIPFQEAAIRVWEANYGPDHPHTATSVNQLGHLYFQTGAYEKVEPFFQRSLAIREASLGPDHPATAVSLNGLALLYQRLGRYAEAEPLLRRSLQIIGPTTAENRTAKAANLDNLAQLLESLDRPAQAEQYYQQALDLREQDAERHPLDWAKILNNIAAFYQRQNRLAEAEPLYERVMAIHEQVLSPDHPDYALSAHNLASLYHRTGRYAQAEALLHRAIAVREQTLGPTHPLTQLSLGNLALLRWAQGDATAATVQLTRTLDRQETTLDRLLAIGSERQKRAYLQTINGFTHAAVSLSQQGAPESEAAARLALTTILRRKGRILDALTDNQATLRQNLTPTNRRLRDRINTTRSDLTQAIFNPPTPLNDDYRHHVAHLTTSLDRLEADLARISAEFRVEQTPVTLTAVQAALPANAALIEFIKYRPFDPQTFEQDDFRYGVYLLNADGAVHWADLGPAAEIDLLAQRFRNTAQQFRRPHAVRTAARELEHRLFERLRPQLAAVEHLLIAPDGELNIIPFAALLNPQAEYLITTHQITLLTSGRDLLRLQLNRVSQSPPVILGDINYGATAEPGETGSDRSPSDQSALTFRPLPATAAEVQRIADLYPTAILFTQHNATEDQLTQYPRPAILHLATHGFFLDAIATATGVEFDPSQRQATSLAIPSPELDANPLLRAGLALAGFNDRTSRRPSQDNDGVLTALEVAGLNLWGTKLVFLSACETGVGDIANGEGVYGLRRALVIAGAESQVLSLWQVDDTATQTLAVAYYQNIQNRLGRSAALRQVQLTLLQSDNYAHPYFWAAFTPSGDWRSL
ncbi:CHAT domain-containing tetratricopeptide repeat protein [Spirulina major]|uniref:CHAT domain-containing tetratricopeptide repeat protein n=1 Tax=Spirulina major TaxID=270636 RepID=UPI000934AB48|nr:CHAT domain-containing tetratricopeptide repeat protein [Spirulina major]